MKPDELLKKLASFEAKGQVISADSRRAAMNAISGKKFAGHAVFSVKNGVRVQGPRARAVAQRLADISGNAATKELKEGLK